ncbi:chemotaxis protein CheW [Aliiglaciecola sp. CAU 1673]|uniref:chemotaxis protein CheW n=1 Tax=Aliiglaciecola sp. CAU 1673 TaxID=3032595 RepID=UPI0023DB6DC0|nr:chemotaxis protein CheW [Aliiglaciecola sp. CAU 1673]MDF2177478.1 chemotaxis protein CheW [Aliiglaciecola sp. CAU 1673]
MKKGQFANERVMEDYLSALLTEDPVIDSVQQQSVARLLEQAAGSQVQTPVAEPVQAEPGIQAKQVAVPLPPVAAEEMTPAPVLEETESPEYRRGSFQALYFRVAGLTLAVPLTELGGIHKLEKASPLIGKPDWFMGVMLHRDEKLKVVDTAQWVMPEKYSETLAESLNYQYLIMLGDSGWGLCCESLVNTVTLDQDDVKWREAHGKRPWLAGLVKEKMCALFDVNAMIAMLDQGLGINEDDA